MDEDQKESRGFRVTDRRRFTDEGETREDPPAAAAPAAPSDPPSATAGAPSEEALTFATFVLGLSTQALIALGEIDHPVSRQREKDLGAARHLIDILAILREKTNGNLQADEHQILESALYDLRIRFVELMRTTK